MGHRILVPFELPDADPLSPVLVDALCSMDVVVLGHFGLPEQTPPDAARSQFGDSAQARLDELARPFEEAGANVTTRLVFGKARDKTIDRIAIEEDCDAELDPAPTEGIERILVPIPDAENFERISDFVTTLCEDVDAHVTLFHVAEQGFHQEEHESVEETEAMLEGARTALIDRGYDPELVATSVLEAEDHDVEILRKSDDFDAVVMGEAHPTIPDQIFGTLPEKIASKTGDPVIIVRRNV